LCAWLAAAAGCATAPPASAEGAAPVASTARVLVAPPLDWHAHLGLQVRIDAPLTISGNQGLVRDGELVASFGGRLFVPTERALPGEAAAAVAVANERRSLRLQRAREDVDAVRGWPLNPPWRSGSLVEGVEGVVVADEEGIALRVDRPLRVRGAARPPAPVVPGDLRLASLNLENLFNGDGLGGGFPTARGARTHGDYLRQRGKLVAALQALNADIVALMELENDGEGPESSQAQLVDALNGGGDAWRFVRTCPAPCTQPATGLGDHPIRVGLIYRADRVVALGRAALLSGGPFGERSRIPLAEAFRAGDGPAFTVAAVHFKSKGCGEAVGADRDQDDGQSCWNATRLESARRVESWLRGDPTRSGSDLAVILGDMNAYGMEDPVRHLRGAGWHDVLSGAGASYSYVYAAQAGRLDHALLSPSLAARLAGAAIWHSNADEAPNVGDRAGNIVDQVPEPWRSSDHDPLLIGLRLRAP
jgi:hypothetical protein